jgi:hypothetical protein
MKNTITTLLTAAILTISCGKKEENYPIDKQVWEIDDYKNAAQEIKYGTAEDEKYPTLAENPEVFKRLTDKNAVDNILNDETLGLSYRQKYSEELFDVWRTLVEAYSAKDRQDKYIYPMELVKVRDWGYHLQIKYFKLGNDGILKDAVDTNDLAVQNVVRSNEQTAVDNFETGISFLTDEDALTTDAVNEYSNVLTENYIVLANTFKTADYTEMISAIDNISKKIKSNNLKQSLSEIKAVLVKVNNNNKTSETEVTDANR